MIHSALWSRDERSRQAMGKVGKEELTLAMSKIVQTRGRTGRLVGRETSAL